MENFYLMEIVSISKALFVKLMQVKASVIVTY